MKKNFITADHIERIYGPREDTIQWHSIKKKAKKNG
jgi:hypothetical protein